MSDQKAGKRTHSKRGGQAAATRGRDNALSDEIIVDAALKLAQRVGVDRITMRGLAAELGVTTMAPYWHLKNKKMLLQAVLEAVFSRLPDAHQIEGTWSERLIESTLVSVNELSRWPGILHAFTATGTEGTHALRLSNAMLETLREAGFDADEAQMAASLIGTWSLGFIAFNEARRESSAERPLNPVTDRRGDYTDQFDVFALGVIVDGLQTRLDRKSSHVRR